MATEIHSPFVSASNVESQSAPAGGVETDTVAVLVLTFNHQAYIEACLQSILENDFPKLHIWVLDDGSSDGTCAVVKDVADRCGRITLITQAQSGGRTSANSQRLIDESKGKYVLFMSGDDMLGSAFPLARSVAALQADEQLDIVLPRLVYLTQDPTQHTPSIYTNDFLSALNSSDPERVLLDHLYQRVSRVFLQGVVARRTLITASGGFDTDLLADDYAFVMRLFQYMATTGRRFIFDQESLWLYRVHGNNIHRTSMRQFLLIVEVVAKYVPREYWAKFACDKMVFDDVEQLVEARAEAVRLLGPVFSILAIGPVERATLRNARKQRDGRLLRQIRRDSRFHLTQRIGAAISLLRIRLGKADRA